MMQKKTIFKTLSVFTLVFFVMSITGAAATTATGGKVVEVTKLDQINTALKKGPVFVSFVTKTCPHCKALAPTLKQLAKEYRGKATIISVDIKKSPGLAKYFGVRGVPDCSVIVGTNKGKYVYMQQNGKTTTVRSKARIIDDRKINVYEKVLNYAVRK
jgi:thiol-disulfide isomerase/thioredoxin